MSNTTKPARRGLEAAFGGKRTNLSEQREIWLEALHEDAIWEGPTFATPIYMVGRQAVGRFMELLLEVVPEFSTQLIAAYPTAEPDTIIIESTGGGPTIHGAPLRTAVLFADHQSRRPGIPDARVLQSVPDLQSIRPGILGQTHRRDHGRAQRRVAAIPATRPRTAAGNLTVRAKPSARPVPADTGNEV